MSSELSSLISAITILLAEISDESSEDIHHPLMLLRAL
jgi:hypothetical protein